MRVQTRRSRRCGLALIAMMSLYPAGDLIAAPKTREITIEGKAAGENFNAMEQAKQDALRRAVEQACGTFINTQTNTKNYAAVYDKVMASAAGYVEEFEVVAQRVEGGVSYCTVRAVVSTVSFESEWTRLAHTLAAEGNPRCMIVVLEDNDAEDENPAKTNGVVQGVLENFFLKNGVRLGDKSAADATRDRDAEAAALKDDVRKLASLALSAGADVVIKGNAEARHAGRTELAGKTLARWTATINIRAYHTDSAQMLMSNSYSLPHNTTNYNAGGDDALRRCAEQHAADILRDIGEAWRKRQNVHRTVQLVLEDCSRADFKALEAALREVDGVQDIQLRQLASNVCNIEVDWSYDTERLVSRVEELKVDGVTYTVTEQTHDRVTLKIVK